MKNALIVAAVVVMSFVAWPALAEDDDFCMDCTEKVRYSGTTRTSAALCCTVNDDGFCFGGYFVVQPNVGWGCQVSSPDESGNTSCISSTVADPCGTTGGGGGGGGGGNADGGDCSSSTGYCPASCSSCTFKV